MISALFDIVVITPNLAMLVFRILQVFFGVICYTYNLQELYIKYKLSFKNKNVVVYQQFMCGKA